MGIMDSANGMLHGAIDQGADVAKDAIKDQLK